METATFAAAQYALSMQAAQRGNFQDGVQIVRVQIDGVTVGQYQPPGTSYSQYQTPAFTLAAGSHTIALSGVGSGGDYTAFVDSVTIGPADAINVIANGGFEAPSMAGSFQYAPAGATWVFANGGGITANASGFTSGNPAAPEGAQVAFLQMTGTATQTVSMTAGQYTLSLQAAQRGNFQIGTQIVGIAVDGVSVGQYQPPARATPRIRHRAVHRCVTGSLHDHAFVGRRQRRRLHGVCRHRSSTFVPGLQHRQPRPAAATTQTSGTAASGRMNFVSRPAGPRISTLQAIARVRHVGTGPTARRDSFGQLRLHAAHLRAAHRG